MRSIASDAIAGAALVLVLASTAAADELWIRADVVHTGDGRRIEKGIVHARDGRIVAVGADLALPEGATLLELPGAEITPGLIDANAKLEPEDLLRPLRRDPSSAVRALFGLPEEEPPHFHDLTGCPSFAAHEEGQVCPICGGEGATPAPVETHGEASGVSGPSAISEQSSEVVPHTAWIEAVDLGSPDLERLLREGVTTVLASPDPSAVIGARATVVRTGGDERILVREGAVRAVIGADPYRFGTFNRTPNRGSVTHFSRRPQSRMGVGWIFRKAFHDALLRAAGGEPSGADTASPEASAVLFDVLEGRVPLWVQARTASDIESALRLCGEFGVPFTLVDPVEAYRCLDFLAIARVPVVFGPIYDLPSGLSARTAETRRSRLHTLSDLVDAGVPLCLSAQDLREEDGLARQAMLAIRTGIAPERVLELVTLAPARIIGIDGEVGSLAAGKRADLVVWSGPPFAATSAVRRVYVDGRLAFERKG